MPLTNFAQPFTAVNPILIQKSRDRYGWMGNMAPFPVMYERKEYRTTEALFQCLRVSDEPTRELIRAATSPMLAKFRAQSLSHMRTTEPLSEADLDLMRICLRVKIETHPRLRQWLVQTANLPIIEDCTKRQHGSGLFWGAAYLGPCSSDLSNETQTQSKWTGQNWLGFLWEELRTEVKAKESDMDILFFR